VPRMNSIKYLKYLLAAIHLLAISLLSLNLLAASIISIDVDEVVICPAKKNISTQPLFSEPDCFKTHASNINPQNTAIWVKTSLNIPQYMLNNKYPHSVFISGKTSSKIYFNGHLLGNNGTPSLLAIDEFPGKIDAMFYVPPRLIKEESNELILFLSSHHGFLSLGSPINFVGFGIYSDPAFFIQQNIWQSFIPLGALILGIIYFGVSCFSPYQRKSNVLFLLMSFFAASQLFIERSRALFSYSYPFQDIRLLLIVSLSMGFGFCLLIYITIKFSPGKLKNRSRSRNIWIVSGAVLTLTGVILMPGFDPKTAIAILVPSVVSTLIIAIQTIKHKTKELWTYLVFFVFLTITILFNLNQFHDLFFYYIITGALCFLFIQQALKLSKEQTKRKEEQQQVAKLQFKLDQNEQKIQPKKIKINSSGKIELISTDKITFCKASGDYVEVNLKNNKQLLFSGNLKELEKQLPATFSRVHRSYIVNMDLIASLKSAGSVNQKNSSARRLLMLVNGSEMPVSRRIMPMVRNVING